MPHVFVAAGDAVMVAITGAQAVETPTPEVHVAHAPPRGRKLDGVIQRLTELGVERIAPLHSPRSEVRLDAAKSAKAHRRWQAVANAAAKQSRRARLPIIDEVEATGLAAASLGPTILRTEFASLAGAVSAMTLVGRFGA